jgi:FMN-dependent NADH-azoreductase
MSLNLLHIDASIHSAQGQSSQLAARFIASFRTHHAGVVVDHLDLAVDGVPHLDAVRFAAFSTPVEQRSAAQRAAVDHSDRLIAQLARADVLVLGLPMYNFGVPSQLKAWFDHIARAGETFRYTEHGPVGLMNNKRAYVFATRGGLYVGTPLDTQTGYVRDFLRFIGIDKVEFVYAEGLAIADRRAAGLADAASRIDRLAQFDSLAA